VNVPVAVAVLPECDLEKVQLTMQAILSIQLSISTYKDDHGELIGLILVFVETGVS
jgi:hypothetical protein